MWRLFKFVLSAVLVMVCAGLAFVALGQSAVPGNTGIANGALALGAGLVIGLFVAWLRGIPWNQLPQRFQRWRSDFAYQCAWAALGAASIAVLLYY